MPSVESGWYLVEASRVLALDEGGVRVLVEWALSTPGVVLVTKPSIVTVDSGAGRMVVVAGVGSLVSSAEPPLGGWLRLSRREWVDGCVIAGEPRVRPGWGDEAEGEGVVVALNPDDPAALFINGVKGRVRARVGGYPLAALQGPHGVPVLSMDDDGYYVVNAYEGPVVKRLLYIAPLASALPPQCH